MSFDSVFSLTEFCNQKIKNSKSNKFPFTYSPLHLLWDKMKPESCKMHWANSFLTTDVR